ncbi:MAG: hypothetical protein HOM21_11405, partial [Halobacteriovoraceae bacterium]|nr:hypothetical protein [Halobacteriovoraceae bacterium]
INLLAFDYNHNKNGTINKKHSTFYIPNEYVYKISQKFPKLVNPVISVHPDRKDAIKELTKYGEKGVKLIKWLPNAMRINPADPDYREYYETVKKYDMAILSHTGHEKAVDGEEYQKLANPLRFKLPLDMGVKIIMAHVASLGKCQDIDGAPEDQKPCFDYFWRLFNNPKYNKNLFAELSGVTIYTRVGAPITKLLEHPELHHRVVNGSDYPLPAINILYRTSQFEKLSYITKKERKLLNEIYDFNPLLFDFVLKRNLKHPSTKQKFQAAAFELPASLGCKQI